MSDESKGEQSHDPFRSTTKACCHHSLSFFHPFGGRCCRKDDVADSLPNGRGYVVCRKESLCSGVQPHSSMVERHHVENRDDMSFEFLDDAQLSLGQWWASNMAGDDEFFARNSLFLPALANPPCPGSVSMMPSSMVISSWSDDLRGLRHLSRLRFALVTCFFGLLDLLLGLFTPLLTDSTACSAAIE